MSPILTALSHAGLHWTSGPWTLLIYSWSCQFWRDGRICQYMDLSIALCLGWWLVGSDHHRSQCAGYNSRLHFQYVCICDHKLIWKYLAKRWWVKLLGCCIISLHGLGVRLPAASSKHNGHCHNPKHSQFVASQSCGRVKLGPASLSTIHYLVTESPSLGTRRHLHRLPPVFTQR